MEPALKRWDGAAGGPTVKRRSRRQTSRGPEASTHNGQRAPSSSLHAHGGRGAGTLRCPTNLRRLFSLLGLFFRNRDYIYLNERKTKYIHTFTRYSRSVSSPMIEAAAGKANRLADEEQ